MNLYLLEDGTKKKALQKVMIFIALLNLDLSCFLLKNTCCLIAMINKHLLEFFEYPLCFSAFILIFSFKTFG